MRAVNNTYAWFSSLLLLVVLILPLFTLPDSFLSYLHDYFPAIHLLLEMLSIFIAFTICNMIWHLYDGLDASSGPFLVMVGMGFAAVGLVSALHTMCYNGMPAFFISPSYENAAFFALMEHYIIGIGFLAAILWPIQADADLRRMRNWLLPANLFLVGAVCLFHLYGSDYLPPLYGPDGSTAAKITQQYLIIAVYVINLLLLWRRRHNLGDSIHRQITCFFIILICTEYLFVQHRYINGSYVLLGHIYKVISFYYLYKAVYLSGVINRVYTMSEIGEMSEELLKDTVSLEKVLDIHMRRLHKLLPQAERIVVMLRESTDTFRVAYSWGRYTYYFPVGMEVKFRTVTGNKATETILFTDPQQLRYNLDNQEQEGKLQEIYRYAKQLLYLPLITPPCDHAGEILLYTFAAYRPFRHSDVEKAVIFQRFCSLAITQAKSQDLISRLSYQDSLTCLPNRRAFFDELEQKRREADVQGIPFTVVYLDMNDLKVINDQLGHNAGDLALKTVGQYLYSVSRLGDLPVRLGGDEFAIIFRQMDNVQGAAMVRELRTSAHSIPLPGFDHHISLAVGGACYPADADDIDTLLKIADDRMYEHKRLMKGAANVRRVQV